MVSNLVELAGMAAVTAGVWFLAGTGVALVVGGVLAIVAGMGLTPTRRRQ
jgi:hypothetical protein